MPPTEWWCGSYLKQMESYLSAVGKPSSYDAEWCGSIIPGTVVLLLVHHCLHMYCMWLGFQLQLPRTSFFTLPLSQTHRTAAQNCWKSLKMFDSWWVFLNIITSKARVYTRTTAGTSKTEAMMKTEQITPWSQMQLCNFACVR